ncbi:hypothetical protein Nepgr_027130 [Nepenthes gracilis]|uniref:RRM domain-containing protein n=1 Tax=Nepenthes gracilis TaxID=150966 RepID=A0AAD3Y0Z7_NEPGR|nr:hypothetical protein Nepgr_027130 [Nepenthes gracilis]
MPSTTTPPTAFPIATSVRAPNNRTDATGGHDRITTIVSPTVSTQPKRISSVIRHGQSDALTTSHLQLLKAKVPLYPVKTPRSEGEEPHTNDPALDSIVDTGVRENATVIVMLVEDHRQLQSELCSVSSWVNETVAPLAYVPPASNQLSSLTMAGGEFKVTSANYKSLPDNAGGLPVDIIASLSNGIGHTTAAVMEQLTADEPYDSVSGAFVTYGGCVIDLVEGEELFASKTVEEQGVEGLDRVVLTMRKGEDDLLSIVHEYALGSTVHYEVELASFEKEKVVLYLGCALSFIVVGDRHRHTGSTNFHRWRSRSHSICTLLTRSSVCGEKYDGVIFCQLHLIDRAGSKSSTTETTGLEREGDSYLNINLLILDRGIIPGCLDDAPVHRCHSVGREDKSARSSSKWNDQLPPAGSTVSEPNQTSKLIGGATLEMNGMVQQTIHAREQQQSSPTGVKTPSSIGQPTGQRVPEEHIEDLQMKVESQEANDNKALQDAFSAFGNILSCKIATDSNGDSKSYGFVQFEIDASAETAIGKLNGILSNDKQVEFHVISFSIIIQCLSYFFLNCYDNLLCIIIQYGCKNLLCSQSFSWLQCLTQIVNSVPVLNLSQKSIFSSSVSSICEPQLFLCWWNYLRLNLLILEGISALQFFELYQYC